MKTYKLIRKYPGMPNWLNIGEELVFIPSFKGYFPIKLSSTYAFETLRIEKWMVESYPDHWEEQRWVLEERKAPEPIKNDLWVK